MFSEGKKASPSTSFRMCACYFIFHLKKTSLNAEAEEGKKGKIFAKEVFWGNMLKGIKSNIFSRSIRILIKIYVLLFLYFSFVFFVVHPLSAPFEDELNENFTTIWHFFFLISIISLFLQSQKIFKLEILRNEEIENLNCWKEFPQIHSERFSTFYYDNISFTVVKLKYLRV